MTESSYTCTCGAVLRYKQDLDMEPATTRTRYRCKDCGTPVPGQAAEKIRHQDPS